MQYFFRRQKNIVFYRFWLQNQRKCIFFRQFKAMRNFIIQYIFIKNNFCKISLYIFSATLKNSSWTANEFSIPDALGSLISAEITSTQSIIFSKESFNVAFVQDNLVFLEGAKIQPKNLPKATVHRLLRKSSESIFILKSSR